MTLGDRFETTDRKIKLRRPGHVANNGRRGVPAYRSIGGRSLARPRGTGSIKGVKKKKAEEKDPKEKEGSPS